MNCYEVADVGLVLGYLFHGGDSWSREDSPDADMPKARANPALGGTHMAVRVDARRAFDGCVERGVLRSAEALWLHHAEGKTQQEIARELGIPRTTIEEWLALDAITIRDAMNAGLRPQGVR